MTAPAAPDSVPRRASGGRWLPPSPWPRSLRTLAAALVMLALGHAAGQCVDVPELGANRNVDVGDTTCVTSTLTSDSRPTVQFALVLPTPGHVHDLVLEAAGATALEVCVDVDGARSCRSADADRVEYRDLLVEGGNVHVRVSLRGRAGQRFQVALTDRGAPEAGFAYAPNDSVANAVPLGDDLTIRGRFHGREVDVVRVDITGDPQLWRVQVLGPTVDQLNLLSAAGRSQQTRSPEAGDRGVRMSNLYLLPGPHYFSVRGTDGEYALRLLPLGPADAPPSEAVPAAVGAEPQTSLGPPTVPRESAAASAVDVRVPSGPRPEGRLEREPNDDVRTAHLLVADEPWVGLLAEAGDVDVYRFYLGEDGPIRITMTPPPDLAFGVRLDGGSLERPAAGRPYVLERWFLAGDHVIAVNAITPADGYYQILLERLDPFVLPDLIQPFHEPWHARPLARDHAIRGVLDGTVYVELPVSQAPSVLTIDVLEAIDSTNVSWLVEPDGTRVASADGNRGGGRFTLDVPAGGPFLVQLTGSGEDEAHLVFSFDEAGPRPLARAAPPPVELTLIAHAPVAAYHPATQRFAVDLELVNRGDAALDLTLDSHVTDYGWRVVPREASVRVPAAGSARTQLDVSVAPVARDDLPVEITVAGTAPDGGVVTTRLSMAAICGLPPIGATQRWPVPDTLLGGINLAWSNLGGAVATDAPSRRELALYDGLTPPGTGWDGGVGAQTTVRLAGDGTPRVVGVLLHPLSQYDVAHRLAEFRILTSLDGRTFSEAFVGRMRSTPQEQGFVFDEPVAARYVRLEALSNQVGDPRRPTGLGQLKVIAEPGARVLGDRVDLGLREHGGHVAVARPYVSSYAFTEPTTTSRTGSVRLEAGASRVWWVSAFHHNRAARIDGVEWIAHEADAEATHGVRMETVSVSVSLESPLGPWTEVGTWAPYDDATLRFDAPVWARFVRFESGAIDGDRPVVLVPDRVAIYEHPEDAGYRSVLGEWGHYAREGVYEWRHPMQAATPVVGGSNATRDTALGVMPDVVAESRVLVAEYDAWFAIDVPAGANFVRLELSGDPTVDYLYRVLDDRGTPIVADVTEGSERVVIEAYLDPGRYYVHAWEPVRNVVFSWDDSGSMGPYIEATYQTVFGFARGVDPNREQVQLQAFDNPPFGFIMPDWSGDPVTVLSALHAYPRTADSSDAEGNLAFVVGELAQRDGTRAVLLVTDAESSPSARNVEPLWDALMTAPARIFAFETSTSGSDDTQDRMQTYADVAGGFYDYSRTLGDLDVSFARASCLLRQPKVVRVALAIESRDPPGPGALVLRRPQLSEAEREAAMPAVHVIFDASGSMGQRVPDGSASRLEVARRVLTQLVDEVIEPGTPFALRAYGHVAPMTCDTALVHPLAPLDRAAARSAIASVEPKLLSGTPLAASIEAVAGDLRDSTGPKTVILLTDGEESCEGDPAAAISALMAQGIDVQLSIVGFDVVTDDAATMRANFSAWAELGGGVFLEAVDAVGLREALESALHADVELPFEVVDESGAVVARGTVDGDAVPLPAGRYTLRVIGAQTRVIDGIEVRYETTTTFELDDE